MKFVIAVVMLVLALGAQSSVVPLSYTAVHGPTLLAAAPAQHVLISHPAPITYHAAPISYHSISPVVAAPIAIAAAEGTYVAQTRGAVHIAPLSGHANSASSVNLEPAPGTL